MREILFRGKWNPTGVWVYGDLTHLAYGIVTIGYGLVIDPKTVGQYTGLDDKNGVKIFEGDIVEFSEIFHKNKRIRAEVFFSNYYYGFYIKQQDRSINGISIGEDMEVIGNVYENPELFTDERGEK